MARSRPNSKLTAGNKRRGPGRPRKREPSPEHPEFYASSEDQQVEVEDCAPPARACNGFYRSYGAKTRPGDGKIRPQSYRQRTQPPTTYKPPQPDSDSDEGVHDSITVSTTVQIHRAEGSGERLQYRKGITKKHQPPKQAASAAQPRKTVTWDPENYHTSEQDDWRGLPTPLHGWSWRALSAAPKKARHISDFDPHVPEDRSQNMWSPNYFPGTIKDHEAPCVACSETRPLDEFIQLPCGHYCHPDCFGRAQDTCPGCRRPVRFSICGHRADVRYVRLLQLAGGSFGGVCKPCGATDSGRRHWNSGLSVWRGTSALRTGTYSRHLGTWRSCGRQGRHTDLEDEHGSESTEIDSAIEKGDGAVQQLGGYHGELADAAVVYRGQREKTAPGEANSESELHQPPVNHEAQPPDRISTEETLAPCRFRLWWSIGQKHEWKACETLSVTSPALTEAYGPESCEETWRQCTRNWSPVSRHLKDRSDSVEAEIDRFRSAAWRAGTTRARIGLQALVVAWRNLERIWLRIAAYEEMVARNGAAPLRGMAHGDLRTVQDSLRLEWVDQLEEAADAMARFLSLPEVVAKTFDNPV
ncbi:hypothetical protein JX265_007620 [Neoarthrinium moseri]|uniref:RING-type domain-containing protein n=1 Tax=Neoarthrinium moseri TaxID=1658444 RepID=A0A9Q0APE5_9PEZI|nr:hypothetical protein JX265_007620 [Neoarthrinium moseri]